MPMKNVMKFRISVGDINSNSKPNTKKNDLLFNYLTRYEGGGGAEDWKLQTKKNNELVLFVEGVRCNLATRLFLVQNWFIY